MASRRTLSISDGGVSSEVAFRLLLDLAPRLSVQSIRCLTVDSWRFEAGARIASHCSSGESTLSTDWWRPHCPELWDSCANSDHSASRVALKFQARARARGISLTRELRTDYGTDAILQLTGEFDIVGFGPSRGWQRSSPGINAILSGLISRGSRPVVLSHPSYTGLKRIVVATRADDKVNTILQIGSAWSECLNLPLTIVSAARTNAQLEDRLGAVSRAAATLGISAEMIGCIRSPARLAEVLFPTDMLMMGAYSRPWPVELCFGSHTEDLVRTAPCPLVILPARFSSSDCDAVARNQASCNN